MTKIILCGANGAMGKNLIEIIGEDPTLEISAGIDHSPQEGSFPQYKTFDDGVQGDVIIDFSHFSMIPNLLDYVEKTKTPAVICTTGLSKEDEARIEALSKEVPLFRSGNMSLGINLLIALAKKGAEVLGENFDIEVVEMHHNRKIDAPSGTAYMIADEINKTLDNSKEFNYGRYGNDTKRKANEIGIHALRGGTVVGEHTVVFAGTDEMVRIEHRATSKKVFAQGAVRAAKFILNKENGLFNMNDML
ncbi:MAG: 4-hydroxy-tetrahydrodipicolinate reductase [Clostridia bacterium]|nr:4-hydroxy-tetrahydrodipicolinate reductase [Clostridia bacterium]